MLLTLLLLACGQKPADSDEPEDTHAPDDTQDPEDTGRRPPSHPCSVSGRAVVWLQPPLDPHGSFGVSTRETRHHYLSDDFIVPDDDGCWCVREVWIWGEAEHGAVVASDSYIFLGTSDPETGGPHSAFPTSYEGKYFGISGIETFVPGQPLLYEPHLEELILEEPAWLAIRSGQNWIGANPSQYMTASAPFAWSAGQAPEGTDTAWVLDPDQVLTETPCPEWTPWPDCAPSSTARDLAFEIHATTPGREACEAWYEWYAENG